MSDPPHPPNRFVVRRVEHRGGSEILPEHDESWPEITQLQWCAGVAECDSGVRVRVRADQPDRRRPYSILVGNAMCGSYNARDARLILIGVGLGGEAASVREDA